MRSFLGACIAERVSIKDVRQDGIDIASIVFHLCVTRGSTVPLRRKILQAAKTKKSTGMVRLKPKKTILHGSLN